MRMWLELFACIPPLFMGGLVVVATIEYLRIRKEEKRDKKERSEDK